MIIPNLSIRNLSVAACCPCWNCTDVVLDAWERMTYGGVTWGSVHVLNPNRDYGSRRLEHDRIGAHEGWFRLIPTLRATANGIQMIREFRAAR